MKNVSLEIKKMLGLLESKMGNVKPIVSERMYIKEDDNQISFETPKEWLDWMKGAAGCLTNKKATIIQDGKFSAAGIKKLTAAGINSVNQNDDYVQFKMPDKYGDDKLFWVLGKRDTKGAFLLIMSDGSTKPPTLTQNRLVCPELTRKGSFTSDIKNLTQEQKDRLDILVKEPGIKETGAELTTTRPAGKEGYDYVPVDLSTGKGTNGVQYIKKTAVDGLGPEFKTEGQAYVWAKIGTSVRLANTVFEVEKLLNSAGYTRDENIDAEPTTLVELCKTLGGYCEKYPIIQRYIESGGGNLMVYPQNPESYKNMGAAAMSGRKTGREIGKVQKTEASKRKCRAAISALHACMKANNDSSCKNYVQTAYSEMGESMPPYMKARLDLGKQIEMCDNLNVEVGGMFGGKNYETMWDELKTSSNEYSPYSQKNKAAASTNTGNLEESLSRNIRLSLKEMQRKKMR